MKPRARRVALAAAVLGAVVVGVLVVTHWDTVRDHIEAWRFQLTRETETITPRSVPPWSRQFPWSSHPDLDARDIMYLLADCSSLPIVVDPVQVNTIFVNHSADLAIVLRELRGSGFRVLEQRFPRRAYVVIRDTAIVPAEPTGEIFLVPFGDPAE